MGCKRLPYYQKYLRREKSFPKLKVVYKRRLSEKVGYKDKYQWELIHNPETILFSALEEESEGEIVKRLISSRSLILFSACKASGPNTNSPLPPAPEFSFAELSRKA